MGFWFVLKDSIWDDCRLQFPRCLLVQKSKKRVNQSQNFLKMFINFIAQKYSTWQGDDNKTSSNNGRPSAAK